MVVYRGNTLESASIEVHIENGLIETITRLPFNDELPLIAPPLFDTQNNGAIGQSFNKLSDNSKKIYQMKEYFQAHGVGKVLGTITTQPVEQLRKTGTAICKLFQNDTSLETFFPGFFHEGIYISKEDGWKGTHNINHIKDPNYEEFKETNKHFENKIKLVNVAPEELNGIPFIEKAAQDGITVSIGHCNPSKETIDQAIKAGATHVTHFGNGAASYIHRHKNPFWTILARDELTISMIGDSFHLPFDLIKAAIKAKGKNKCLFVSDCSDNSGLPPGEFQHNEHTIAVEPNGYMHIKDQDILAGSWHQLDKSVETLCKIGWKLKDAWYQCSLLPAKSFHIQLEPLEVGKPANFVMPSFSQNRGLVLDTIFIDGQKITPLPLNPEFEPNKT